MARKPQVIVSIKSAAERSLLRFYLSASSTPNTVVELGEGGPSARGTAALVIAEPDAGESAAQAAARLRTKFPKSALVLLVDAAGPLRAVKSQAEPELDAVLVRALTLERLDAVLGPMLRRAARPDRPRVLVVDDDPEVLHFVEQVLGKAGCEVTSVSDPQRYLSHTSAQEYDLALLDVVMPEVDGLQICLRLRAAGCDELRICMMSAADDPETERKADLYGADEFVPKPLHVGELHALIGRTRAQPARRPYLRSVETVPTRRSDAREEFDLIDR